MAITIGAILFNWTKLQNSNTAINKKTPNRMKKVSIEYCIEAINNKMYIAPDIDLFSVSFILKIF